jgi:hypothetical protein
VKGRGQVAKGVGSMKAHKWNGKSFQHWSIKERQGMLQERQWWKLPRKALKSLSRFSGLLSDCCYRDEVRF